MEPTRSTFSSTSHGSHPVEVLGYRIQSEPVEVHLLRGLPAWRWMIFHDGVPVETEHHSGKVAPHTMFIFPPDQPTRYGFVDRPWSHSWLRLSDTGIRELIEGVRLPVGQPIPFGDGETSDRWLSLFHHELTRERPAPPNVITALLRAWVAEIAGQYRPEAGGTPTGLQKVRDFIESHPHDALNLDELAEMVHLSPRYLCVQFRQAYGLPPIAYGIHKRIEHACELLMDANLSVAEVAVTCGFRDFPYFSRQFKRVMGESPTPYRKAVWASVGR